MLPVDFPANSDKLVNYAAAYAAKFPAWLSLLNVIENSLAYEGIVSAKFDEELKAAMEKKMNSNRSPGYFFFKYGLRKCPLNPYRFNMALRLSKAFDTTPE